MTVNWYKRSLRPDPLLLKEAAEGAEHARLRERLHAWARERGFTLPAPPLPKVLGRDPRPDVCLQDAAGNAFIGDAKDAKHETADRLDTWVRIRIYVAAFAQLLEAGTISGGTIALATDDRARAEHWTVTLTAMALSANLAGPEGRTPSFIVESLDEATHIVWW